MRYEFSSDFASTLVGPGDSGYADEIAAWTGVQHTPEMVIGATSAADVAEVVRFAGDRQLRVAVQTTGHGTFLPITSGVLISTRRLDRVDIDPTAGVATIGAGARWDRVVAQAAPLGLFPVVGASSEVGVIGYLASGGLGPLARSHGYSSDYLISATVVIGDGSIVRASADENIDLFWALRGGKDGFGS